MSSASSPTHAPQSPKAPVMRAGPGPVHAEHQTATTSNALHPCFVQPYRRRSRSSRSRDRSGSETPATAFGAESTGTPVPGRTAVSHCPSGIPETPPSRQASQHSRSGFRNEGYETTTGSARGRRLRDRVTSNMSRRPRRRLARRPACIPRNNSSIGPMGHDLAGIEHDARSTDPAAEGRRSATRERGSRPAPRTASSRRFAFSTNEWSPTPSHSSISRISESKQVQTAKASLEAACRPSRYVPASPGSRQAR